MPECQCRTKCYKLMEDYRCLNKLFINIPTSMVLVHLHVHSACPCPCFMSMLNVHVPVHVHAAHHRCVCVCECMFVFVCINAGMPDCPASDQFGTAMKKLTMPGQVRYRTKPDRHFLGPVPDRNYWCRNADAGISFLDADAQLWYLARLVSMIISASCYTIHELWAKLTVSHFSVFLHDCDIAQNGAISTST